jgi:hypothetical protein
MLRVLRESLVMHVRSLRVYMADTPPIAVFKLSVNTIHEVDDHALIEMGNAYMVVCKVVSLLGNADGIALISCKASRS